MISSPHPGITQAAEHLLAGGIVGMPTETVYGLAAVATDPVAVARVFAAKERPLFDPLIAHVRTTDPAEAVAVLVSLDGFTPAGRAVLERLWNTFWPGPLTLVLPRSQAVPDLVTAGLGTVGVRMPAHPVADALITAVGIPLVAPSANRFGRISPTTAEMVVQELGDRVRYVLDGGPCRVGVESTVLAVGPDGDLRLLRPGGIPVEALIEVGGRPVGAAGPTIEAPGQTASHYAPRAPLTLLPGPVATVGREALGAFDAVGLLVVSGEVGPAVERLRTLGVGVVHAETLSASGDAVEAARRLFGALRALDDSGAVQLIAEPWTDRRGLGHAIADRLERAAAPRPR